MSELAHGLISGMEIVVEIGRIQLVSAKSEAVGCNDIARTCIESIIKNEDLLTPFIRRDALA